MRSTSSLSTLLFAIVSMVSIGCDTPGYPAYDRAGLLRETADMVIVPGYTEAASRGAALHTAVSALCASPSATTLGAAQDAWRDGFLAWRGTSAYQLGPSTTMNLGASITGWPANTDAIETNVAALTAPAMVDAHYVDTLGATVRGFATLEYLLFWHPGATQRDDAMTLAALSSATRCAYAEGVAEHIERTTATVRDAWSPSGGNFAGAFAAGTTPFSTTQAAVDALMTDVRNAVERTKVDRIGKPIGRTTATGPVESPYAGLSVASMQAGVESAHEVWTMPPHGLDAFLRTRNPTLADQVLADFDAADTALGTLESPPLAMPFEVYASGTDTSTANAAYDVLGGLEMAIAGDVASTLGVSITSPADGD